MRKVTVTPAPTGRFAKVIVTLPHNLSARGKGGLYLRESALSPRGFVILRELCGKRF